ncbi:hypothetical protein FCV25MIE_11422 [Fagus crenata]
MNRSTVFPAASWWAACGIEVGREERLRLEFAVGGIEVGREERPRPWRIAISSSSLHSLWKSFFFESSGEMTPSAAFGSKPSFFAHFGDNVVSVFGRLVVFDEAKSSMGLEAIGLTFGSGGDSESVSDSEFDPDPKNESRCFEIGAGFGFLGWGFLSVTGVDGKEEIVGAA